MEVTAEADIDTLQDASPVWEAWAPNPSQRNAISVHAKLLQNNHKDVRKCTVDPHQARALSDLQGIPPETGFWLIPPVRAPHDADVRLFCCADRCAEAGTSLMIPEFNMGYPAALGSTVLVKKGVAYGMGVLRTDIFDLHVKEGRPCCSRDVVMLKSTQESQSTESIEAESLFADQLERGIMGPVKALEQYASKEQSKKLRKQTSSTSTTSNRNSVTSNVNPLGRFSVAAAKRADVARRASGK
ncbi:hypothetical protein BC829DRAFT_152788 [Chytridium lagenaria]|nr:hypothetical protein BC829DRAFT_152788 [Chytridium lagenaria]